jgi:hypothetical protein
MKRATWAQATILGGLCALAAACSGPPADDPRPDAAAAQHGWTRTPAIHAVRTSADALVFSGAAEPGARVVLRSAAGEAYAAVAGDDGRFEIPVPRPRGALLLRPETQVGQEGAESPDRLVILDGGRGPVAVLRAGGAAVRLDGGALLGAIDSDGRATLASGRSATPDRPVEVTANGAVLRVRSLADGSWSAMIDAAPGDVVTVDGRDYRWPAAPAVGEAADGDLIAARAGDGWAVRWSGPSGARQTTWLPDVAPA